MASSENSLRGRSLHASQKDFLEGLRDVVDYRGDITISLKNGSTIEGYVFNQSKNGIDLFPKNSPRAITVLFDEIESFTFSGEDTANGKSYEDWITKKESEKAKIKAQPIELV